MPLENKKQSVNHEEHEEKQTYRFDVSQVRRSGHPGDPLGSANMLICNSFVSLRSFVLFVLKKSLSNRSKIICSCRLICFLPDTLLSEKTFSNQSAEPFQAKALKQKTRESGSPGRSANFPSSSCPIIASTNFISAMPRPAAIFQSLPRKLCTLPSG